MAVNITYNPSTNRITITGGTELSPANFNDIVTFDRAGTLELLASTPGNNNLTLTRQIRPVELRALKIDFIVAGKTAETDYIHITGTDFRDNALQETIDISAGNGTYTTTKYFRTITDIDCNDDPNNVAGTIWADGTVQVIQNQWGVIHDYSECDTYYLDALLYVGNGSTSTFFKDLSKIIVFTDKITGVVARIIYIYNYATFQLGELVNLETKETCNGCTIHVVKQTSIYAQLFYGGSYQAKRYLYGCTISTLNTYRSTTYVYGYNNDRFWNCNLVNYAYLNFYGDSSVYNITLMGGSHSTKLYYAIWLRSSGAEPIINDFKASNVRCVVRVYGNVTAENVIASANWAVFIGSSPYTQTTKLIDCSFTNWIIYNLDGEPGEVLRQYSCNINVKDRDGSNLSGANVKCYDKDDNLVFDINTNSEGNISEQAITYQRWSNTQSVEAGEDEAYCYSPHKFLISKTNYETLEIDNITVDKALDLKFELQDPTVCDYPSEDDVEEGVQYDSGNKTGNFHVPTENEVKKEIKYGANETEFEGTYFGEMMLVGQNLSGELQKPSSMEGQLQKSDSVEGVLQPKDELSGILQKKNEIKGELEDKSDLTGEKE